MSVVEANISIDVDDDQDYSEYLRLLEREISKLNGKPTKINVIEVDDPLSLSPIALRNLKE